MTYKPTVQYSTVLLYLNYSTHLAGNFLGIEETSCQVGKGIVLQLYFLDGPPVIAMCRYCTGLQLLHLSNRQCAHSWMFKPVNTHQNCMVCSTKIQENNVVCSIQKGLSAFALFQRSVESKSTG